jgi:type II secretory pathway pseudopilin PulG
MLAMFSLLEILIGLVVAGFLLTVIVGGGIFIYAAARRSARSSTRDEPRITDRE